MIDFEQELYKLLDGADIQSDTDEFEVLINENYEILQVFGKTQNDISLQIEEIYDIIHDTDNTAEILRREKEQSARLLEALIALIDIVEDFYDFARRSNSAELEASSRMMWKKGGNILETCAISRLGEEGQPLDPELHSVQSTQASQYPREHVARVLQSGYRYMGTVLRKASVSLSTGEGESQQ